MNVPQHYRVSGALLLAGALLALGACGNNENNTEPTLAGEGDACQVDGDCQQGLACRMDVCTQLNVDPDMGNNSTGENNNSTSNGQTGGTSINNVTSEGYIISYVLREGFGDEEGNQYLYALDTSDGSSTQVTTEPETCEFGCWLSRDLQYLVYIRPTAGVSAFDVYVAGMDGLTPEGSGSVAVNVAERVQFLGDRVAYLRTSGGSKTAYFMELGSTEETPIGPLEVRGGSGETQDSWLVDPRAGKSLIFSPTLQTLSIRVDDIGERTEAADQIYLLDGSNYQEVGGSYFGTNIPSTFSPNGQYLAVLTTAPNLYNLCSSNNDCDQARGQHCGGDERCTAREVTIRLFDLEALDEIASGPDDDGKTCSPGQGDCSPAHECYSPSDIQLDLAECIPRRVVLGLPNTPRQPRVGATPRPGCELTQGDDELQYTEVRPPMSFGPDGNLYVTAGRQCNEFMGETNVGDTAVLRISPLGGMIDVITGNIGENFEPARCYDDVEMEITTEDCPVYIEEARLSPDFNEVAFLGTNPEVTDPDKGTTTLDVWTILRDGTDRTWLGGNGPFQTVVRMDVHDTGN